MAGPGRIASLGAAISAVTAAVTAGLLLTAAQRAYSGSATTG